MTKWGIIGVGNMGGMLLETWVNSGSIAQEDIMILNRSAEKALQWKKAFPSIHVADSTSQIADYADILFLCVRPPHLPGVCHELHPLLQQDQVIVSITSPYSIEDLSTCTLSGSKSDSKYHKQGRSRHNSADIRNKSV